MSVIGSNIIAGASGTVETGYQIARSLRFNSADSAYLNRTPGSAGNRKTFTYSTWLKRASLASGTYTILGLGVGGSFEEGLAIASDVINFYSYSSGAFQARLITTQVFRDAGAWMHVLVAVDTTQATSTNRIKLYINGQQVTAFSTGTYPSQNYDFFINSTNAHNIGRYYTGVDYFNGYLADSILIDGQALDPTSFGQTDSATGVWVPKAYTGTYGTNGFWLKLDDNSGVTATTLGKDSSGNGNNWTPNNFSVTAGVGNDSLVDSPTNYGTDTGAGGEVRGNYCTWNPLQVSTATLSNGNLDCVSGTSGASGKLGTMYVPTGKWYYEITPTANGGNAYIGVGGAGTTAVAYAYDGRKWVGGTGSTYGATYTTNDVIGVAVDADNRTVTFYKNGVSQGVATTTFDGPYTVYVDTNSWGSGGVTYSLNTGQRPFAYTAPSGFKALCTQNLPTPAIGASASTLASKNFDVSLYTGTGAVQSITNSGSFQPDFVWLKNRNSTEWHSLFDSVRGALLNIRSNSTNAEVTATGTLTSFNSNGFSLGTDPSSYGVNTNTFTYAAWQWKANGAGVSNTAGSITSTVSANTTAGISVVTFTAPASGNITVGHGLGVTPAMFIVKSRSNGTANWYVWHKSLSSATNSYLELNTTIAAASVSTMWGASGANSTTLGFTTGNSIIANATEVAYCFAEIAGFSKFGSYTGNGSTDGPFVYCGFRPRWIMFKKSSSSANAQSWNIIDAARLGYNAPNYPLYPNSANAEATNNTLDILSNGFKIRVGDVFDNESGGTYIFAAFAEAPFNYARAR